MFNKINSSDYSVRIWLGANMSSLLTLAVFINSIPNVAIAASAIESQCVGYEKPSPLQLLLVVDRSYDADLAGGPDDPLIEAALDLTSELSADPQVRADAISIGFLATAGSAGCAKFDRELSILSSTSGAFPCVFVSASDLADSDHISEIRDAIGATKNQFSTQGGPDTGLSLGTIHQVINHPLGGFDSRRPVVVALVTAGRIWIGAANDWYGRMRLSAYEAGVQAAQTSVAASSLKIDWVVSYAQSGNALTDIDAYQTMCSTIGADPRDC